MQLKDWGGGGDGIVVVYLKGDFEKTFSLARTIKKVEDQRVESFSK